MVQWQIFHSTWSTRQRNLPLQSCLIPFPQMNYVLIVVLTTSFLSLFPNLWVPFILCLHLKGPSIIAPCSKLIQPPRPNYVLPPLWSLPWSPQLDKPSPFPELLSWAPITCSLCYFPVCKTLSLLFWGKPSNCKVYLGDHMVSYFPKQSWLQVSSAIIFISMLISVTLCILIFGSECMFPKKQ